MTGQTNLIMARYTVFETIRKELDRNIWQSHLPMATQVDRADSDYMA